MVPQKFFVKSKRFWAILVALIAGAWPLVSPILALDPLTEGDAELVRLAVGALGALLAMILQFVAAKSELTVDPGNDTA